MLFGRHLPILGNYSKLKHPPSLLLICQAAISLSDSVRNLGFYLDKDLSIKEHISFICKTAFQEIWHINTIRHYLTDDANKTLVVSLILSHIDCCLYCNSVLAGLPQSLVGKLQKVQNCVASHVVHAPSHVHVTAILRHLHWLPVTAQIFCKT